MVMVLFININVGQRVEVYYNSEIHRATIKYKGGLSTIPGDWVGVELDEAAGKHSGIFRGREYFTCRTKHGLFVDPSRIRFSPLRRKALSPSSYVDETLFRPVSAPREIGPRDPVSVSDSFQRLASTGFKDPGTSWFAGAKRLTKSDSFSPALTFNKSQTISRSLTPKKCQSALGQTAGGQMSPLRTLYSTVDSPFISRPTIPKTHMPHSALKLEDMTGWACISKSRDWSI